MKKIEWLFVIVASGIGICLLMLSLGGKPAPLLTGLNFLFVSQILTAFFCLYAGWPGKPNSLDERKFYRLMGQVQIDGNTTIVVITDAKGKVFCIKNPQIPFPPSTEFVSTFQLPNGKWTMESASPTPTKPEDSKET